MGINEGIRLNFGDGHGSCHESGSEHHFPSTYQISFNFNIVTPMASTSTPVWSCVMIFYAPTAPRRHMLSFLHQWHFTPLVIINNTCPLRFVNMSDSFYKKMKNSMKELALWEGIWICYIYRNHEGVVLFCDTTREVGIIYPTIKEELMKVKE